MADRDHSPVGVTLSRSGGVSRGERSGRSGKVLPGLSERTGPGEARRSPAGSWYASNGTTVSRVLSTALGAEERKPAVAELMREIVLGADDREQVSDTQSAPFSSICELSITDSLGEKWLGTGWLAAPRLVVTAGHCVYLANQGGWARSITVFPGRNGTYSPFVFEATELHSVGGWVDGNRTEDDYGALVLPSEARRLPGHLGYGAFTDSDIDGELVNIVGYPLDKSKGTMWGSIRTIDARSPDVLYYDNDTAAGMSGSPAIFWNGDDYVVLGIHTYGDLRGNRATRITKDVFRNIRGWAARASAR